MVLRSKQVTPAEKIISAAAELFAAKPYNEVSVKEIAALAGVNNAMISYYFGGKGNLYRTVLERQIDGLLNSVEDIEKMPINPMDKLRTFMDRIINNRFSDNSEHNYIYTSIVFDMPGNPIRFNKQRSKLMFYIKSFSKAAQDEKLLAPGFNGDTLAYCLQSILGNYLRARYSTDGMSAANAAELRQRVTSCYCNLFETVQAKR